jgi:hypothetical protein
MPIIVCAYRHAQPNLAVFNPLGMKRVPEEYVDPELPSLSSSLVGQQSSQTLSLDALYKWRISSGGPRWS